MLLLCVIFTLSKSTNTREDTAVTRPKMIPGDERMSWEPEVEKVAVAGPLPPALHGVSSVGGRMIAEGGASSGWGVQLGAQEGRLYSGGVSLGRD